MLSAAEIEPPLDGGGGWLTFVQEEEEFAPEVALRDAAGLERAVREGVGERDARHAADAEPGGHRPLDGLGVLEAERDAHVGQEAPHGAVEGLARARAALAHDPGRRAQLGVAEGPLA